MFRLTTLLAIATLSTGSAVFAGDTVTINVPGGATQGALTISLASSFTQRFVTAADGQQSVRTGNGIIYTVSSPNGTIYTVFSPFVSSLLSSYLSSDMFGGGLGSTIVGGGW